MRARDFPEEIVVDQWVERAAWANETGRHRLSRDFIVAAECAQLALMWRKQADPAVADEVLLAACAVVAEKAKDVVFSPFSTFYEDFTPTADAVARKVDAGWTTAKIASWFLITEKEAEALIAEGLRGSK